MNMPYFMDEQQIQSTSQLFSNIYLSRLDDFVKRELKLRHYGGGLCRSFVGRLVEMVP